MTKGEPIQGTGIQDKGRVERFRDVYTRRSEFLRRFKNTDQQEPPFENYLRVSGKATINGIIENVSMRRERGQKSVILIAGSLGEGKTTLLDELEKHITPAFAPDEIALCTAEGGLSSAMTSIHSSHKSGEYTADDYRLGSGYLEADVLEALYNERVKLVMIEAPSTTGIQLPNKETLLGMDRGTSAMKNIFGPDGEWGNQFRDMLVGAIGLTNKDFKKGLRSRQDVYLRKLAPVRGGSYISTVKAEREIWNLLASNPQLADLFGIPDWTADYYPVYRREIQLARLEWLFNSYFQFPKDVVFIGEGSFRLTEQQPPVLHDS